MESQIFQIANTIALFSWIMLIVFQTKAWTGKVLIGIIITILSIMYAVTIFSALGNDDAGSFSSLEGVMSLFTNERAVLAGWIHYLVFDLLTGIYIVKSAQKNGINRYVIIPCLILTFMLGPLGLLLYLLVRTIHTKHYFQEYL
jgi:hypothetical protein